MTEKKFEMKSCSFKKACGKNILMCQLEEIKEKKAGKQEKKE